MPSIGKADTTTNSAIITSTPKNILYMTFIAFFFILLFPNFNNVFIPKPSNEGLVKKRQTKLVAELAVCNIFKDCFQVVEIRGAEVVRIGRRAYDTILKEVLVNTCAYADCEYFN